MWGGCFFHIAMIVHLSYYLPELILVHSSALCWLIFVYWQTGELGKFMLCWLIFVYLCTGELDITLQHRQIHAALAAISQS